MEEQQTVFRKNLLTAVVNHQTASVEITEITLSKGQPVPKHYHPCPVVGYIKSGTVLFQIEGEDSVILREGDAFYEPKDKTILHFDNASIDQPLIFVAFYLKKADEPNIQIISG